MSATLDLTRYRLDAEEFLSSLDREYYEHYSGRKPDFAVAEIYRQHSYLFERSAIEELKGLAGSASGDDARRLRALLQFAVDGFLGQSCKREEEELAKLEASLEVKAGNDSMPYRQSAIVQASERDPKRRQAIEEARLNVVESRLNPLYVDMLKRAHELSRELGWPSYREMYTEIKGVDLAGLEDKTRELAELSEPIFEEVVGPELEKRLGYGFEQLRRADLSFFLSGVGMDDHFPSEQLVPSFVETMSGIGIDVNGQANVILDLEERPNKSPRAFCAPVRIPDEIYLVVPRIGGRDDYFALFHEGGHSEHFAHVDQALDFEFKYLGDSSVTEGFAFLFNYLIDDPNWLERKLGITDADELVGFSRASKMVYLRRYAAKLRYELDLHAADVDLERIRGLYGDLLSGAVHCEWPEATFVSDVDPGYYAANYLRAWALETEIRKVLRERFGGLWFEDREAGDYLKSLWSFGQRLNADELCEEISGTELDFTVVSREL